MKWNNNIRTWVVRYFWHLESAPSTEHIENFRSINSSRFSWLWEDVCMGFNLIIGRSLTGRDLSSDWLTRAVMPLPQVYTGRGAPPTNFSPWTVTHGPCAVTQGPWPVPHGPDTMVRILWARNDGPHLTGHALWPQKREFVVHNQQHPKIIKKFLSSIECKQKRFTSLSSLKTKTGQ
jgi:hypothetical protein